MIKIGVIGSLAVCIVILGLTFPILPPDPYRDPVPNSQIVAHSIHCSGCHGFDATGQALVDHAGNDVNIFDDWQISMMALSAHDPFWRATLNLETNVFPSAKAEIETTCLRCHAPLGSIQSQHVGEKYTYEKMLGDSLGLDGVSCSGCHQQPAENLGKGHSGIFTIDTNRILYGHYPNPFQGPMQIYVGFEPRFSDHIYSGGLCAGCHTLITETLDETGAPTGNFFVEQATYHEWLNSVFPAQGKDCQTCHMPFINDGVVIATDFLALEERYPYGLHQFFGANTAMLELMREHKDQLGLPTASSDAAWDETISNTKVSLRNASQLNITNWQVIADTLYLNLEVKNKTGHKLPSGYPSRLGWLQVVLTSPITGDTLYANGVMDADGHIAGRDFPYEPHHEVSYSDQDVQIYELVMQDMHGQLTTRLNGAASPFKDNRLLPLGFRTTHSTYDTVAIWGNAATDEDYATNSQQGADHIEYRIPVPEGVMTGDLHLSFRYQSLPARWMNDLFSHDSIQEVNRFKTMYAAYKRFDEVMDSIVLENIDLDISASHFPSMLTQIQLYPNPVMHDQLFFHDTSLEKIPGDARYEIYASNGTLVQQGTLTREIRLSAGIRPGLYYITILSKNRRIATQNFTVL